METSFSDSKVLGRFVGETACPLATPAHSEELKAAYHRITKLETDLLECREYLEDHVDVNDGDDGPVPNRAMALVSMIDESLHGPGNF